MLNFRKKVLILPKLQQQILKPILVMALFIFAINISIMILFLKKMATLMQESSTPEATQIVLSGYGFGLITTLAANGVILIGFLYFFYILSNRIAGPIYRIELQLTNFEKTGEFQEIKLRETDLFQILADQINRVMTRKQEVVKKN